MFEEAFRALPTGKSSRDSSLDSHSEELTFLCRAERATPLRVPKGDLELRCQAQGEPSGLS